MRIVTWNVNSIRSRKEQVLEWLKLRQYPEVVCLQEIKCLDEQFPAKEFEALGYSVATFGQKTYNGVAILSKSEMKDIRVGLGNEKLDKEARFLAATIEGIRIMNVYVPNGQAPQTEKYVWKFEYLQGLNKYLDAQLDQNVPTLLCGDFNIAPEDIDVWDASKFPGHIMRTDQERNWLKENILNGWDDLYRVINGDKREYSWYDYITRGFVGNRGWRIDFIFTNKALTKKARGCVIDCEPRAWEKPSDHCPVVAKFDLD